VPVIVVVAGMTGCFGGMSLAAGLASYVVMTRQARLSMNGPEVIEQEAGIEELDARDRPLIWNICGGAQRYATGLADMLVEDDAAEIAQAVRTLFKKGRPAILRSDPQELYVERLKQLDPAQPWTAEQIRESWKERAR